MWIIKNDYYENTTSLDSKATGKGKQIFSSDGPEKHFVSDLSIQNRRKYAERICQSRTNLYIRKENPDQPSCSRIANTKGPKQVWGPKYK